jgi:hypothetical protein
MLTDAMVAQHTKLMKPRFKKSLTGMVGYSRSILASYTKRMTRSTTPITILEIGAGEFHG